MFKIIKLISISTTMQVQIQNAVFKWSFHFLRNKSYPNLSGSVWKSNCPLNKITDCATLGRKNCISCSMAMTLSHCFVKLICQSSLTGGVLSMNAADVMGFKPSKKFVQSVHKIFTQKSWRSRYLMANMRQAFVLFLVSSGFHLETHLWILLLLSMIKYILPNFHTQRATWG